MATPSIPIRYVPAAVPSYGSARLRVFFSVDTVPVNGTVTVAAKSSGGWVFDINVTGEGEGAGAALVAMGGTCAYVSGFSGDDTSAEFTVTHDGMSSEVVIVFNTRPD